MPPPLARGVFADRYGAQGSGNLRKAVQLPEGEDLNEWLAVHGGWLVRVVGCGADGCAVVDFFNHLNMLYGTITEFCTPNEVRVFVLRSRIC